MQFDFIIPLCLGIKNTGFFLLLVDKNAGEKVLSLKF